MQKKKKKHFQNKAIKMYYIPYVHIPQYITIHDIPTYCGLNIQSIYNISILYVTVSTKTHTSMHIEKIKI